MKECAKVSVVIPVYNVEKYLSEALDSIICQSLKDIEIICINDGSTDGGPAILDEYAAKDSRIKVYHQENRGLGAARNAGLSKTSGEYVYFFDSDDKLEQTALEKLYELAEGEKLDLVLFEGDSFYESEELEEKYANYKALYHRAKDYPDTYSGKDAFISLCSNWEFIVSSCLKFHRRGHLVENNLAFPEGIYFEDEIFSVEAVLSAERVRIVKDTYFLRRVRDNSIITDPEKDYAKFFSYHKNAWLVLDYIDKNHPDEDVTRWLVYRASSFIIKALEFYGRLDDGYGDKSEEVCEMDWKMLVPVILRCRNFFYEEKKHILCREALDELRHEVKRLNYEKQQYLNEAGGGYKYKKYEDTILRLQKERQLQNEKIAQLNKEKKERYEELQKLYKEKGERWKELQQLKKELHAEKNKNRNIEQNALVIPLNKKFLRIVRGIKRRIRRLFKKS